MSGDGNVMVKRCVGINVGHFVGVGVFLLCWMFLATEIPVLLLSG